MGKHVEKSLMSFSYIVGTEKAFIFIRDEFVSLVTFQLIILIPKVFEL